MNESNPNPPANTPQDRLLDLLADHTLGPLSADDRNEMNTLLQDHPELQDDALEEAAALLLVAEATSWADESPVPASLQRQLKVDAERFIVEPAGVPDTRSDGPGQNAGGGSAVLAFLGGVLATAAAVGLYFGVLANTGMDTPPEGPSYARFIETTEDVATYPWAITEAGYEQVTGEVAWSPGQQGGYMVLNNLPINDPAVAQYQLWIVDPTRDEFPVDGGVFNVGDYLEPGGTAYVPIDAKLRVDSPAAFAITLEQPGGVVKSNNDLLVVAAAN